MRLESKLVPTENFRAWTMLGLAQLAPRRDLGTNFVPSCCKTLPSEAEKPILQSRVTMRAL
jgi:hypothetical protein